MTGLRRLCVAAVIFGALAPSGAGVATAVHELLEHGSFDAVDAVTLAALFHGHRHSADATDHDHDLVRPSCPACVIDGGVLPSGSRSLSTLPAPKTVAISSALDRSSLLCGCGPPPGISPLRV